jgi:hypothetical protein
MRRSSGSGPWSAGAGTLPTPYHPRDLIVATNSFGQADRSRPEQVEMPTPVLHVGEVHAELRLNVTDATLLELGAQIGVMIASSVRQAFAEGMTAAMQDLEEAEPEPQQDSLFAFGSARTGGPQ